jgi:hypothetical protein
MRRVLYAVLAGVAVLAPARSALAAGEQIEGRGFRARAPAGFRLTDSVDEKHASRRAYARPLASGGELILVLSSRELANENLGRTEMATGRMVDLIPAPKPTVTPAQVEGAEDAFEVDMRNEQHTVRSLVARQDAIVVTLSITAPAGAHEDVEEAWKLATSSLRLVHPGAGIGTMVVWLLCGLVVLAVLVTVAKKRRRQPSRVVPSSAPVAAAPVARNLPRDPFAPDPLAAPGAEVAPATPAAAPEPFPISAAEPAPSPDPMEAAVTGGRGGGFSRAEDGLPIFTAAQKAAGINLDAPRRRPETRRTPVAAKPAPAKPAPGPAALTRPPSPRPPLPVVKGRTPTS